jgi:hypothetical protein
LKKHTGEKTPTAEEVSNTLDRILDNYDHRLRPNIGKGPLYVQSDVFITGRKFDVT